MSDMKNFLRDAGYFAVGAAAVLVEVGGKAVKCLVRKGEKTLRENQDTVDDLKCKAKKAGEKIKEAVQDLNKKDEAPEEEIPVVEVPEVDPPVAEAPEVDIPAAEAPVMPDAIYRTEVPAPQEEPESSDEPEYADEPERPEETPNG